MPSSSGRRPRIAALVGTALLGALPSLSRADPAPSFSALLDQAQSAPRIAEGRAEVAEAEGLARQAAARPNPTFSLGVENFGGSGPFRGIDAAETTASIEQPLELGGRRSARIASGRADVSAAEARARLSRAEYATQLAEAYAQAEAADLRLAWAREALDLAREDVRIAGALVEAGREAELRLLQARAAALEAESSVERAGSERTAAFARLTALAGSPVPLTSIPISLLAHADQNEAFRRPDSAESPAYLAAARAVEAAERRVGIERSRRSPDVSISFGLRRFEEDDSTAVMAGASVSLPIFDRNDGNIAATQGALSGAQARLRAARADAEAESIAAVARAQAAQSGLRAAVEGERVAGEATRLALIGYRAGRIPLIEVLAARRALNEARERTLTARLERLSAEAAIARLSGIDPFGDMQ